MTDQLLAKRAEAYVHAREALERERSYPHHTPNALAASHVWRGILRGYSAWRGHKFASYVEDHPESLGSVLVEPADTFRPLHLAELICSHSVLPPSSTEDLV